MQCHGDGVLCRTGLSLFGFLLWMVWVGGAAEPPLLQAAFSGTGLQGLAHRGKPLLADDGGPLQLLAVRLRAAGAAAADIGPTQALETTFAAETKTQRLVYPWGEIACRYGTAPAALHLHLAVTNRSDKTLESLRLKLLRLSLPLTGRNRRSRIAVDNWKHFCLAFLDSPGGPLALGNWEFTRPVTLAVQPPGLPAVGGTVTLDLAGEVRPTHPVIDDAYFVKPGSAIAPGETRALHISLHAGEPQEPHAQLAPALLAACGKERPQTLSWDDRRPVGTVFLCHPHRQWPTNPRGYICGKKEKEDVTSAAGLAAFGTRLVAYAERCVPILKAVDAQGVIVWDLEGQECPHPISYLGDPRALPRAAPEMDRYADTFFQVFTRAGLRVGVTIRPTAIYEDETRTHRWWHREVEDPVALMSDKIAYARRRWGCTLFYLDSNVIGKAYVKTRDRRLPWVMPMSMLGALAAQHPEVLIIPEWSQLPHYACAAPYRSCNLRQTRTHPLARAVYPNSLGVFAVNAPLLEERWTDYLEEVRAGSLLLFPCWYPARENYGVRLLYEEAALLRAGPPAAVRDATGDALLPLLQDTDLRTRYHAALQLATDRLPAAAAALGNALADPHALVRRQALLGLGRLGPGASPAVRERLVAWLQRTTPPEDALLRTTAAHTLGSLGEDAVAPLLELLSEPDRRKRAKVLRYAVIALGDSGTQNPQVGEQLIVLLAEETDRQTREVLVAALGRLRVAAAVEPLIALLQHCPAREEERLSQACVTALGRLGDARAIQPLVDNWQRRYTSTVVYTIGASMDTALRALTGEEELSGRTAWTQWWARHRQSTAQTPAASGEKGSP